MSNMVSDTDLENLVGLDEQNPEECAHIVQRLLGLSAQQVIALAVKEGFMVTALCGYQWQPAGLAPDGLGACRACVKEWERIVEAGG